MNVSKTIGEYAMRGMARSTRYATGALDTRLRLGEIVGGALPAEGHWPSDDKIDDQVWLELMGEQR